MDTEKTQETPPPHQHPLNVGERVAQVSQKAREGVADIRNRATAYGQGAEEFLDAMALYIKENPQRAALIAGAAGVSLGIILGLLMRGK